ncbi:MAG: GuaB3 family IMP dehydrogenase-related protein [Actinomycetota bacterium]|nr:GuaB3 family IMP dehydrogenase-related protein [Actinomycetota bacterium]
MRDHVEIGLGRTARRGYDLEQISIIPSRRTRDVDDVSIDWQIDAFQFRIPMMSAASDAVMSPAMAVAVGEAGGLGVLDAEGIWTRYEDPTPVYARITAAANETAKQAEAGPAWRTWDIVLLREIYAKPVDPDLIAARVKEIKAAGVPVAMRVSPQRTTELAPAILAAGTDVLVIQGTIVSAEHVTTAGEGLNLKEFIADLDVPVIVGGCADYQTALHLMRTGAAGVIVGPGEAAFGTDRILGIRVHMATAIADAVEARRDYLDETGGRYVHVLAGAPFRHSGDIARALACGADAVVLGECLSDAEEAPTSLGYWESVAAHPRLPRAEVTLRWDAPRVPLSQLLFGPSHVPDGRRNLFGALARTLAKTGYRDLKEFQKVDLVLNETAPP